MQVDLVPARREDKGLVARLFQLYAYDFSEVTGDDPDAEGLFRVPPLDRYWQEATWRPFLLQVGGRCAGFAIVNRRSGLMDPTERWDMAEFFVVRRHRRAGVGTQAAVLAFQAFPGPWQVRQMAGATAATAFWRTTIRRYTGGQFHELDCDDARWRGPVQLFHSPPLGPPHDRFW